MNWTPEQDAELVRLLRLGYSATQIGMAMHASRNAIIGRTHRLEQKMGPLDRKRGPYGPADERKPRLVIGQPSVAPIAGAQRPEPNFVMKPRKRKPETAAPALPILVAGKLASILKVTGCRWPVTDDAPHRFCNGAMKDGSSYCEHHHARAYTGLPVKRQAARRPVIGSTSLRAGVWT